jgi:hypothetical protein
MKTQISHDDNLSLLTLLLLGFLEDLLDNLLLFNQECPYNTIANAVGTP